MAAPLALRSARRPRAGALLVLLALVPLAVGALAVTRSSMAFAVVGGLAVLAVVLRDIRLLPLLLVFTMFVESLSLGSGLRVGRAAGALAILVVVYYLLDRGRAGLRGSALLAIVGAWGLWTLVSVYWASASGPVYSTLASFLLGVSYTVAIALLVRRREDLRGIYLVIALGALVFGLVGFVEYVGASDPAARASGLQGDPNYFAVYQVIALPVTLVLAAFERRAQRRVLLYGVVAVIVLSVVASLSRTGLVALVAVVLATLVLPARLFFVRAGRKLTYVLALVGAGVVAIGVGGSAFTARFDSIFSSTSSTGDRGAGRTDLWAAAWHGYTQHPWSGLGAGNFTRRALELLQTTPGVDTTRNYITTANVVHNGYLEQLTELGPVGLALWLAVLVVTARYLVRAARRARAAKDAEMERYAAAAAVGLLGYAISVFFLSNELGKPIWVFVGLALALDVMTRRWEPLLAGARSYDRDVGEQVDDPEARLQRERLALSADRERFDRRRVALDEREQRIALRERGEAAGRELEAVRAQLAEREAQVEALGQQLERLARAPVVVPPEVLQAHEEEVRRLRAVAERRAEEVRGLREQQGAAPTVEAVEALAAELAEVREAAAARAAEVERVRGELAESRREATERAAEMERLQAARASEVEGLAGELAQMREAAASQQRELRLLAEAAETREEELAALRRREGLQRQAAERPVASLAAEPPVPTLDVPAEPVAGPPTSAAALEGQPIGEPLPRVGRRRDELEPEPGCWNLEALRAAWAPYADDPQAVEWETYSVILREHADIDGTIPVSFDGLVWEVYGDLIEHVRRASS